MLIFFIQITSGSSVSVKAMPFPSPEVITVPVPLTGIFELSFSMSFPSFRSVLMAEECLVHIEKNLIKNHCDDNYRQQYGKGLISPALPACDISQRAHSSGIINHFSDNYVCPGYWRKNSDIVKCF